MPKPFTFSKVVQVRRPCFQQVLAEASCFSAAALRVCERDLPALVLLKAGCEGQLADGAGLSGCPSACVGFSAAVRDSACAGGAHGVLHDAMGQTLVVPSELYHKLCTDECVEAQAASARELWVSCSALWRRNASSGNASRLEGGALASVHSCTALLLAARGEAACGGPAEALLTSQAAQAIRDASLVSDACLAWSHAIIEGWRVAADVKHAAPLGRAIPQDHVDPAPRESVARGARDPRAEVRPPAQDEVGGAAEGLPLLVEVAQDESGAQPSTLGVLEARPHQSVGLLGRNVSL